MKDSKGHGSNPRGTFADYKTRLAAQRGRNRPLPSNGREYDAWVTDIMQNGIHSSRINSLNARAGDSLMNALRYTMKK